VSQQLVKCDLLTAGIVLAGGIVEKFRQYAADRGFQVEISAFVEKHSHRCRCDRFGDGSEVEERCGINGGIRIEIQIKIPALSRRTRQGRGNLRIIFVGEVSESFQRNEFRFMRDRDRGGWEGTRANCFFDYGKSGGKFFLLVLPCRAQRRRGRGSVQSKIPLIGEVCAVYSRVGIDGKDSTAYQSFLRAFAELCKVKVFSCDIYIYVLSGFF
jgi:hypothetical protein